MSFLATFDLLAALKTFLETLAWADSSIVFDRVDIYREPDLVRAAEELYIFKNRIAVIVPGADVFDTQVAGRNLTTGINREFAVLVADRHVATPQKLYTGDALTSGIVAVKDRVIDQLHGANLGLWPTLQHITISSTEPFSIVGENEKRSQGRTCWQIQCLATLTPNRLHFDRLQTV